MENRQNMINIEEKLDVPSWLEKGEWIVDMFVVAYIQFVEMLIKLENVLYEEVKCLLWRLPQFFQNKWY